MAITRERAERVARAHACVGCREYTWRRISVTSGSDALRTEFGETWHALLICGVCGVQQELGIDADGTVIYVM